MPRYRNPRNGRFTTEIEYKRVVRSIERQAASLNHKVRGRIKDYVEEAEEIYAGHAPEDSGNLIEGIRATDYGDFSVGVEVTAEDPESGYDYVDVTRFGHATDPIMPVNGGKVLDTKLRPNRFQSYTKGVEVSTDWVSDAETELDELMDQYREELADEIEDDWGENR